MSLDKIQTASIANNVISVSISLNELKTINNCLNEVCHGVDLDENEFVNRIGFSYDSVCVLLREIKIIIDEVKL